MTTMSRPFSRPAIIPVSLLVLGLFMLSGSPTTLAAGMALFLMAGVVLTIIRCSVEGAASRHRGDDDVGSAAGDVSSADLVPNSWPNSGFRNSSKRRTRRS